ncbi:MAG: thioesterase domain-containing protein [Actinomycetota bacterium]|nr:thioesterase domain-containing protein [Actinomycetota bacterium]
MTAEVRLFCFPYSGCGASMYHRWPRRLGTIDMCYVQPPARESRIREPHFETYAAFASSIIDSLPDGLLDRPFGFFGHCGGALYGVELARRLAEAGLPAPRRVFVSSQVAPQEGPAGRFLDMDDDGLAEELRRLTISLGGTPAPELIKLGLRLLTADLDANREYRFASPPPLPCGVTAIGWTDDHEIPTASMAGWKAVTDDCREVVLDGGHHTFLQAPPELLAVFAEDLTTC